MRLNLAAAIGVPLFLLMAGCAGTNTSSNKDAGVARDASEGAFCSLDDECGAGSRCSGGLCITQECTARTDCPSGRVCSEGECVLPQTTGGCTLTDDCPQPYLCDGFSRRCYDPDTGEFLGGSSSSAGGSSGGASSTGNTSSAGGSSSSSSGGLVNLGGYRFSNEESGGADAVIPSGTMVPQGGLLIVARNASRSEFQQHWGVTLGSNVVFINSANDTTGPPVINGGESFTITGRDNQRKDGPTITGSSGKSVRRTRASSPGSDASWAIGADSTATPGTAELRGSDHGIFVSEWSDASGGGNYVFEFIEFYVNP